MASDCFTLTGSIYETHQGEPNEVMRPIHYAPLNIVGKGNGGRPPTNSLFNLGAESSE